MPTSINGSMASLPEDLPFGSAPFSSRYSTMATSPFLIALPTCARTSRAQACAARFAI